MGYGNFLNTNIYRGLQRKQCLSAVALDLNALRNPEKILKCTWLKCTLCLCKNIFYDLLSPSVIGLYIRADESQVKHFVSKFHALLEYQR